VNAERRRHGSCARQCHTSVSQLLISNFIESSRALSYLVILKYGSGNSSAHLSASCVLTVGPPFWDGVEAAERYEEEVGRKVVGVAALKVFLVLIMSAFTIFLAANSVFEDL
jgi:hypothetical protein